MLILMWLMVLRDRLLHLLRKSQCRSRFLRTRIVQKQKRSQKICQQAHHLHVLQTYIHCLQELSSREEVLEPVWRKLILHTNMELLKEELISPGCTNFLLCKLQLFVSRIKAQLELDTHAAMRCMLTNKRDARPAGSGLEKSG